MVPEPKKRRHRALAVDGSLAIPDVPFAWEGTLLSMYLATLLGEDDEPASGA